MGILWSKFRSKESSVERLERITDEIRSLEDHKFSAIKQQRNLIFLLFVISGLIYIFALGVFYFYYLPISPDWVKKCLYSLPLLVFPLVVYLLKQFLQWYYLQVIDRKEDKLKDLRREKRKILDKVMETETYKVAKELLEKYDPSALKESRPSSCPSSPANPPSYSLNQQQQKQPQRVRYRGSMPPPMLNTSFNLTTLRTPDKLVSSLNASQMSISGNSPQPGRISMIRPPSFPQYPALPAPRLARPILDQNRSIVDKLVDYVVGDGPGNRYALICNICSGHNGMALKEEFEYITFRCCYCMSFNPARKQRPFAPNNSQTEVTGDKNLSPLIDEPESDSDGRTENDNRGNATKIAEIKEKGETSDSDNSSSTIKPVIAVSPVEGDVTQPTDEVKKIEGDPIKMIDEEDELELETEKVAETDKDESKQRPLNESPSKSQK